MTVKMLIEQLLQYPMTDQVCDTEGDIIMYAVGKRDNKVYLEPKGQIDLTSELDAFFEQAEEYNMSDNDAAQELKDRGFTINDLYDYRQDVYEWAIQTDVDW